jgi:hypothetical protein
VPLRIMYLSSLQVTRTAAEYFHIAFEFINHAFLVESPGNYLVSTANPSPPAERNDTKGENDRFHI